MAKSVRFYHLPDVFVAHLKRFKYAGADEGVQKILTDVEYPTEGLELADYRYHLFAVIVACGDQCHHGEPEDGHYYCYIKAQHCWFLCDDHTTIRAKSPVVPTEQFDPDAYILFYRRTLEDHEQTSHRPDARLLTPQAETADRSVQTAVKLKTVPTNLIQRRNLSNSFKDILDGASDPFSKDLAKTLPEEKQTRRGPEEDLESGLRESQATLFTSVQKSAGCELSQKQQTAC